MKAAWLKKTILTTLLMLMTFTIPMPITYAACPAGNTAKGQVLQGVGETGGNCTDSGVNGAVSSAVTILSIIVGIAATIMILVSGFRFITSGGDSGKVAAARSALIYALIGVAVAALAQFLVHFVLNAAVNPECPTNPHISASDRMCR